MRILIFSLMLSFLCSNSYSQSFTKGNSYVSLGYGFSSFSLEYLSFGIFDEIQVNRNIGPIFAKYEYGFTESFGMGMNVAFAHTQYSYFQEYDSAGTSHLKEIKDSYIRYSILARLNYHFGTLKKFDPYFGISLGYRSPLEIIIIENGGAVTSISTYGDSNTFGMELTMGARYFFTEKFGLYAELGLAKAPIQIGCILKFVSDKPE